MSPTQTKILIASLFFLFILISGYWLSRLGKPYPALVINLHKLIGIGAAVYLGIAIHRINQAAPLTPAQWAALAALIFFALITVISGGLSSVEKTFPAIIVRTHHFGPYFTILSCATFFYLTFR